MLGQCVVAVFPSVAHARRAIDELRICGFPQPLVSALGTTARQSANLSHHPIGGPCDRPAGVPQRSAVGKLSDLLQGKLHLCLRDFGVLFVGGRLATEPCPSAGDGRPAVLLGMLQPLVDRGVPTRDASRLTQAVEEGNTLVIAETDPGSDDDLAHVAASALKTCQPISLHLYEHRRPTRVSPRTPAIALRF